MPNKIHQNPSSGSTEEIKMLIVNGWAKYGSDPKIQTL